MAESTRSFKALFAADLDEEKIEFAVPDAPEPGYIVLRPMNAKHLGQYQSMIATLGTDGRPEAMGDMASITAALRFLVAHTLTDCRLWTRQRNRPQDGGGFTGTWQETRIPEGASDREKFFSVTLAECTAEFWDFLGTECLRANGLLPDQEGNSAGSTSN